MALEILKNVKFSDLAIGDILVISYAHYGSSCGTVEVIALHSQSQMILVKPNYGTTQEPFLIGIERVLTCFQENKNGWDR